jgi:DNA-binding NarL/FixJ family response regulator
MNDDTGLNVVIVDDHLALRRGLELLLRQHGHHVVGVADDAEQARGIIERRRPHVAVIDLELPGENGAELTSELLAEHDWLHVLLYTGVVDTQSLSAAMDCGATGFALKSGDPAELLAALGAVAEGRGFVDDRIRRVLLARETTDTIAALSEREREVLDMIADGLTGEEIAKRLFLSPETIRTHLRNAMTKLEATTRAHAIAIALREGVIT